MTTYKLATRSESFKGSFLSVIMQMAHHIRRSAARKYACEAKEIIFSECLVLAWSFRNQIKEVVEHAYETVAMRAGRICFEALQTRKLTVWERGFASDTVDRVAKYGERTQLSEKQLAIVERLEHAYCC